MPLVAWVGWAWIKSLWEVTLLPFLAKIPWQVWVALGIVIAFFWYGHVREKRALQVCYAQVEQAKNEEIDRQRKVSDQVVADAKKQEAAAQEQAISMKERLDHALEDVAKLKQANQVCLPKSVTDQFRGVRKSRVRK